MGFFVPATVVVRTAVAFTSFHSSLASGSELASGTAPLVTFAAVGDFHVTAQRIAASKPNTKHNFQCVAINLKYLDTILEENGRENETGKQEYNASNSKLMLRSSVQFYS